jgi:hypothetical protein
VTMKRKRGRRNRNFMDWNSATNLGNGATKTLRRSRSLTARTSTAAIESEKVFRRGWFG